MALGDDYITAAMLGLEELLLASETFCTATGLPSQQKIRDERIHWGFVEHDPFHKADKRPLAVINDTEEMGWAKLSESYGDHLVAKGAVELYLAADPLDPKDHKRSQQEFSRWVGTLIGEMAVLTGTGNYFPFEAIQHATRVHRTPLDEESSHNFFYILLECPFDAQGGG